MPDTRYEGGRCSFALRTLLLTAALVVPLLLSRDPALIGALASDDHSQTSQRLIEYRNEIEAASLDEAVARFGRQAQLALNDTLRRLEELRREQASSLIVPGGANMPGSRGGRGGIQIP